jgi:hypothetical protein
MPIAEVDKIWMDGELVDWAEAKIHVLSHALHYGSGVFEDAPTRPIAARRCGTSSSTWIACSGARSSTTWTCPTRPTTSSGRRRT